VKRSRFNIVEPRQMAAQTVNYLMQREEPPIPVKAVDLLARIKQHQKKNGAKHHGLRSISNRQACIANLRPLRLSLGLILVGILVRLLVLLLLLYMLLLLFVFLGQLLRLLLVALFDLLHLCVIGLLTFQLAVILLLPLLQFLMILLLL
jgi:hypothetical protein